MKMDWLRNAYLSGIFILGFLLILEFDAFSKQRIEESQQLSTVVAESAGIANPSGETIITPSVDMALPSVAGNLSAAVTERQSRDQLIHVRTDSIDLQIDKFGGDIVNAALPMHKVRLGEPEAYTLLNRTNQSIYTAESGLVSSVGAVGIDTSSTDRPLFTSQKNEYILQENEDKLVVDLEFQQDDIHITKRFSFSRNDYLIQVEYLINNQSSTTWQGALYGQIRRDSQKPPVTGDLGFGVSPYLGMATTSPDNNYEKITFSDLEESQTTFVKTGGWIAMVQHYFVSAWIPDSKTGNKYLLRKLRNKDIYLFSFSTPEVMIEAGQRGHFSADYYVGPKDIKRLESIAEYLDLTIDFGFLWWIAKPLFQLLLVINDWIGGNWGWSIIILTMMVKLVFFYPSAISYRSMAKMRKLAPKMKDLKERHGDDRQKMSQEMMKLYRTEKVNPMGGCLPILIQMPVFIALYWVLMESVELRHAPFILWIDDLSVKDPTFILPLVMGLTMYIQQKLNPTPPDPMQAKIMQWMPVAFTFMFLWFPAGLVIYWVTNNTLSIIQQYIITRKIEAAG